MRHDTASSTRGHVDGATPEGKGPPVPESALKFCRRHILPGTAGPVLLAVSGGSDSMALLAAAEQTLAPWMELHVVHVHHGLRGSADLDADLVRHTAAGLGLPATVIPAGPSTRDAARTETAARRRRFGALHRVAQRLGASSILLAHHRNDDDETVLLRLLRGHEGDRALAGMPAVRPLTDTTVDSGPAGEDLAAPPIRVVRPFVIGLHPPGRKALAEYRTHRSLPHIEDPGNADVGVARNRVRRLLAAGDPSMGPLLAPLRLRARQRLQRRLAYVLALLEQGALDREGLGSRLDAAALDPAPGDDRREHQAELLRMLAGCLARPRRADPRAALLDRWSRLAQAGHGTLDMPAEPAALHWVASRDALHLPAEAPGPGSPRTRALSALFRTSLYL